MKVLERKAALNRFRPRGFARGLPAGEAPRHNELPDRPTLL